MTAAVPLDAARQVRLPGGLLNYTLRRSRRARRLRLTVDPLRGVLVTVPVRGAVRDVEAFLREREAWLRRHLQTLEQQRARAAGRRSFGPDGRILFRGETHRLRVERASPGARHSRVVVVPHADQDEVVIVWAAADRRSPGRVLEVWLRAQALAAVSEEIALHASALGVTPAAVSLRDPRTRWGSATRTHRLSFSWRLILAPPRALETVVVHELAHLRVFGHGAAFWAIVANRVEDHRAWRKWLREHSLELHEALEGIDLLAPDVERSPPEALAI